MSRLLVLLACLAAAAYAGVTASGPLIRLAGSTGAVTLRLNLHHPLTWLVVVLAALVAWGLWRRYRWAWWLGLAGALVQLFRMGRALILQGGPLRLPDFGVLLPAGLLLALVLLLLTRPVRTACGR
jgi:hypothetical protein